MPRTLLALLILSAPLFAQGTQADYDRSAKLRERFDGKVFRDRVEPKWYADGTFSYEVAVADKKTELVLVDPTKPSRTVVKADDLKDKKPAADARPGPGGGRPPRGNGNRSPDGKWEVKLDKFNVVLVERETKAETPLTTDGKEADAYERVLWAPTSKHFVVIKTKAGGDRKVTLVESSPKDQLQPKTSTMPYLKPGDPIPQPKPHLFDVAAKKEIPLSDELFNNPWDVSYEHWTPDGSRFLFLYNQRGHGVMRLVALDAATGKATALIDEQPKTFFDYAHKLYLNYLDETNELIWMSERDGWNHLYLIDTKTGDVKKQITKGEWLVRRVERVDAKAREITFQAFGIHPKQDPYHAHFARIKFDGTGLVLLTDGDGTHAANTDRGGGGLRYSPDGKHYLVTHSRVDSPPTTELRRTADGKKLLELEKADASALEKAGWKPPERFVSKGRDGTTDIHGVIHRPTNFDPKKKYPVIEYIYAGPQGFFVPKAFRPTHQGMAMAELGFIVVQMDGMGTNWRSKAFHDVCWKNLGDSGFADRIKWIQAAAAKYPEMDLSKGVGIYGGSAGGQSSTRAVFAHPDFYSVAVSDCGCHDNRMDKVWWNELWMSWPVGKHYAEQSNTNPDVVKQFKGKLMLVVGELDKNVDPASTMQVANALIRANKDFDLLIIPGGGHGACETPYGQRRRADFFVRHLHGVEPRAK
ncbi:MAG: S9 family peptidase [Fimbriiglobus sp.]|nr:S9 family peptidase [Fimbriiglobus sp.]